MSVYTGGQLALIGGWALLLAAGQILFKQVAVRVQSGGTGVSALLSLGFMWSFWGALTMYGIATLLWIQVLRTVPLSKAYPFLGFAFVLVPLAGVLFFRETIGWKWAVGTALIVAGVLLTSSRN